ncbi:uncharacterized protein LOC143045656 isoform X1 [Mytilus galloprovincialis]|uniref:uncharacterized protein LOC143045656 isoform X1 n=1 Tax=Mytilus galloprovincialis TaxID=29158 RepID=UPI003F7B9545
MASSINEICVEVDDIREIFRQICPYIIRQWKEVCRKLGIQELELAQLEAHEYHASKAHLAFKGLSLWYEHVGKSATKDKLVSALKQCGLHRAEEEIERLELRTLKVSPSNIRPSSRQPSASKRRPGTGHREPNGCISRPPSRTGSANSQPRRGHSSKGRQPYSNRGVNSCEMCFKISVTNIDPLNEAAGVWREKLKEMTETFYEAILVNTEVHMRALENALNIREISVTDIQAGSLLVRLKLLTLGALESFNQMYKTRRLLAICQNVFITENALKTTGAKNVGIKVELSTEVLDHCREFFLSRKFKESVHPTDTLPPPSFESYPCLESSIDDYTRINSVFNEKWRATILQDVQRIQERSTNFDETMDEYIRILNIIMPKGKEEINSLSELLQLYTYLNKTHGVSSGVRLDLFREYLMIVNSIRLTVDEVKAKLQTTVQRVHGSDDMDDLSIVQCLVDDLEHMLQPDTIFEEDFSAMNRTINPSEKQFSKLVCFIPLLLERLSTVLFTLSPSVHEPVSE